jgi:hypothetical protein
LRWAGSIDGICNLYRFKTKKALREALFLLAN